MDEVETCAECGCKPVSSYGAYWCNNTYCPNNGVGAWLLELWNLKQKLARAEARIEELEQEVEDKNDNRRN